MNAIRFSCACCGRSFRLPAELAGRAVTCPECKEVFALPPPPRQDAITCRPAHVPQDTRICRPAAT